MNPPGEEPLMSVPERVRQAVEAAIDDVNLTLPEDRRLERSPEVVLVGEGGRLDSLGLVNFAVALEQRLKAEFQKTVSLTELVMAPDQTPFGTIGALCEFVSDRLKGDTDGVEGSSWNPDL